MSSLSADVTGVTNPAAETIVRASCPECGDVELRLTDLVLRVCMNDGEGSYSFVCPDCEEGVSKPAEAVVVQVLLAAGVSFEAWSVPAEVGERPSGPPISHDDLVAFHVGLEDPAWFATLEASVEL